MIKRIFQYLFKRNTLKGGYYQEVDEMGTLLRQGELDNKGNVPNYHMQDGYHRANTYIYNVNGKRVATIFSAVDPSNENVEKYLNDN